MQFVINDSSAAATFFQTKGNVPHIFFLTEQETRMSKFVDKVQDGALELAMDYVFKTHRKIYQNYSIGSRGLT